MEYEEIAFNTRGQLAAALLSGDADKIVPALLGVVLNDPNWEWLQDKCLELLNVDDIRVPRAALLGLGHVARLHRRMNVVRVRSALRAFNRPQLAGEVEDVLEDIELFVGGIAP